MVTQAHLFNEQLDKNRKNRSLENDNNFLALCVDTRSTSHNYHYRNDVQIIFVTTTVKQLSNTMVISIPISQLLPLSRYCNLQQRSLLRPQHTYTIILLKSVCRCSQTAGRSSCSIVSGNVSNCSYRLTVYPVTSLRLNSA